MPSSIYQNIPTIINEVLFTQPNSVLDVGVGFGKMGHLIREYTEVWDKRYLKSQWLKKIDGIEIFAGYLTDATRYYYSQIYIGDAIDIMPHLDNYDLIIANDVIEHIEKEKAKKFIETIIDKSNKKVIISMPIGKEWLKANTIYIDINPAEAHISSWEIDEMKAIKGYDRHYEFSGVRGKIGLFIYEKNK